jgi:uncharacterized protein (TIGR02246 family)
VLNRFVVVILGGLLVAGCSQPAPPAPAEAPAAVADAPADVAAINAAREAFMKGYEAGDAKAIAELYTTDAISEPNGQATLKGREAIVEGLTSMFQQVGVKATLTTDEVRTLGNFGIDRGHYVVTVTPKAGAPASTSEGRYLVIYRKGEDGTWRAWRDIDNVALPQAAPATATSPAPGT